MGKLTQENARKIALILITDASCTYSEIAEQCGLTVAEAAKIIQNAQLVNHASRLEREYNDFAGMILSRANNKTEQ